MLDLLDPIDTDEVLIEDESAARGEPDATETITPPATSRSLAASRGTVSGITIEHAPLKRDNDLPAWIINGVHEDDIWAAAPVFMADRLHWVGTDDDTTLRMREWVLPQSSWVRLRSDGHGRLWVPAGLGEPARVNMVQAVAFRNLRVRNLRVEKNVPFRDFSRIEPALLDGIVIGTTRALQRLAYSTIAKVATDLQIDAEDAEAMLYLYISDLLDQFDNTRQGGDGRTLNFLAFAHAKVRNYWAVDLIRGDRGRGIVDDEQRYHRAVEHLALTLQRTPTDRDVADHLNITIADTVALRNAVQHRAWWRDPISLSAEANQDSGFSGIDIATEAHPDTAAASAATGHATQTIDGTMHAALEPSERLMHAEQQAELSRLLLSVTTGELFNPLGFHLVYLTTWGGVDLNSVAPTIGITHADAQTQHATITERLASNVNTPALHAEFASVVEATCPVCGKTDLADHNCVEPHDVITAITYPTSRPDRLTKQFGTHHVLTVTGGNEHGWVIRGHERTGRINPDTGKYIVIDYTPKVMLPATATTDEVANAAITVANQARTYQPLVEYAAVWFAHAYPYASRVDTLHWDESQVKSPLYVTAYQYRTQQTFHASVWRHAGFAADDAGKWVNFGITDPGVAKAWGAAGWTASAAHKRWPERDDARLAVLSRSAPPAARPAPAQHLRTVA